MKIDTLVTKFDEHNPYDISFNFMLNLVADYIMYEQAIVKKDNRSNDVDTIKYRYDEKSYRYVNEFFSKIEFLSKPKIGKGKKSVIKDLPDDYKFTMKHEVSIEDKIYILDKIKDSFMHLHGEDTLYDFDHNDHTIVINNDGIDFSLHCKIPVDELFKFNQKIKVEYDKSTPNLDWVNEFLYKSRHLKEMRNFMAHRIAGSDLYGLRVSRNKRVIFGKDNQMIFLERTMDGVKSLTMRDFASYHTDSYVSLLMASGDGKNYPLLNNLYDFDFHCENTAYRDMINRITKEMNDFGLNLLSIIEHLTPDKIRNEILKFLFRTSQNGDDLGLISDIAMVNNKIIGTYLRNARSHANKKGTDNASFGEENILYYDVSYNSILNTASEKAVPTFAFQGKKKDYDRLFSDIRTSSISNRELYEKIVDELTIGNFDTLNVFLDEVDRFIIQADIDGSIYANSLSSRMGNAKDFTDFIRKALNGTFIKDDYKSFVKV